MKRDTDPEIEEVKDYITGLFYRDETVYELLFPLIEDLYKEIEKNKQYRGTAVKNLAFYIKGTLGLLLDLYRLGHIPSLKNPHFSLSDIDAVLLFNVNTPEHIRTHLENVLKSIFQRLFYMHRLILENNRSLIRYMRAIGENYKPYAHPNIMNIRKIKRYDSIKYKKKDFVSKWKKPSDDERHNITIRINETIENKDFFLYRLWAPFSAMLKSGRIVKVEIELVDVSLQKIFDVTKIPSDKLFDDIEKVRKAFCAKKNDAISIMKTVESIREFYKVAPEDIHVYDLHLEMWHRVKSGKEYLADVKFKSRRFPNRQYTLPVTTLKYQFVENIIILINDPTDVKTQKRITKIKILLDYLFSKKYK